MPSSVGQKYYAKESLWTGSAESEAAAAWRRSPDEWGSRAAAALEDGATNTALAREQEDDEELASVAGKTCTIVKEKQVRFAFFTNLVFRQLY